jgi:hypothetical protein
MAASSATAGQATFVPVAGLPELAESVFFAGFVSLDDDPELAGAVFWSAPAGFSPEEEESAEEPLSCLSFTALDTEDRLSLR